jgi:hypothetical protein
MTYSILISSKPLEIAFTLAALVAALLAIVLPRLGTRFFRRAERSLGRLARKRARAILFAAGFPMIARVLLVPVLPLPRPYVHDEFSYLLMADTFAHARVANPPPPEWRHFETEYVLMQPTYASQYQPAQGLVMAAGQMIAGGPWWGVWASVGLMCGLLCWALQGMVPARWALCGALGAALQFGIFGFWMNSYFGGAIAAAGGALVFGSLKRLRTKPRVAAAIGAAGLVILLASRPLEGAIWFAIWIAWITVPRRQLWRSTVVTGGAVLITGVSMLALYNWKVTGHVLRSPYQQGRAIYGTPQSFWWQPAARVQTFSNPQLRANYLNQLDYWNRRSSVRRLWESTWRRLRDFWRFYIGPFFTAAVLFLPLVWRRRALRPWVFASIPFVVEHATYHAWYPQQSASETVLIVLFLLFGWRDMRASTRGLAMSRNLAVAFIAAICLLVAGKAARLRGAETVWASLATQERPRDRVETWLAAKPGKHLVFVRYSAGHSFIDEWVFNKADIPGARVVFARMIDPESDAWLIDAMPFYDVWRADADTGDVQRLRTFGGVDLSARVE